jgi:hypothetical protein
MVLVIYFVYNRLNRTPVITTESAAPPAAQPPSDYDGNNITGKIGNFGVGTAKNVRFTKLNAQKQVVREFGFEELLHQDGNDWQIEKPTYTVYGKQFKSTLTGDKATVTVETSGGQIAPREGTLTGNVTIRILPTGKASFSETMIYLDDVTFSGDKSLFSTDGFVEIDSNEVEMKGTGLEVVFSGDDQRLEHLKIAKLKTMRLKHWPGQSSTSAPSQQKDKTGDADKPVSKTGHEYKCVLDRNVVIETPQQLLLADVVSISNFAMYGGPGGKTEDGEPKTEDREQKTEDRRPNTEETPGDVNISCNGSIVIIPMDSDEGLKTEDRRPDFAQGVTPGRQKTEDRWKKAETKRNGRTMLCGSGVDYDAATGRAVASGPSQIIFDVNSRSQQQAEQTRPMEGHETVKIVSQKEASFQPALNRADFTGDCKCTVTQKLLDANQQYFVTAENIEAVLKSRTNNASSMPDIERLIAKGGEVRLASTKKIGEQMLAGVEMKCEQMDYNTLSRDFYATGPGLIKIDNSQTDERQKGLGRFSLRRRCYAFLRNFDSLQFAGQSGHLTADAGDGSMLVDYFPVSDPNLPPAKTANGKTEKVSITASRVEADLSQTTQGRTELADFTATGAVTYTDKNVDVAGSKFVYDVNNGLIDIMGDKNKPLLFNGAVFDSVQYDVKNDKWKTKIKGPGPIR